jgi:hypothetical protein
MTIEIVILNVKKRSRRKGGRGSIMTIIIPITAIGTNKSILFDNLPKIVSAAISPNLSFYYYL